MHPCQGPFDRELVFYRYVVNEMCSEYIDRMDCRGREVSEDLWVGDVETPTNDRPGSDFADVTRDYIIW